MTRALARTRPFRMILDTGAHVSVVDSALRAELSLPLAAGVRAAPMGGGTAPQILTIPELRLVKATLRGVTVLFSDVRPGPSETTGNIGYEALKKFAVTIDTKNRRIRLTP